MSTKIVVLAAGKGTRMKSRKPKVLHCLAGTPLLQHVLDNVAPLNPDTIFTVIGHGGEQVVSEIGDSVTFVTQEQQLGTGHAVQQVVPNIENEDKVLIVYGDVPLTRPDTFKALLDSADENTIGLLTVVLDNPAGYGRVVRNENGDVMGIIEEKDASSEQKRIAEVNTGMLAINGQHLKSLLADLDNNNAQGEYYLTDIFEKGVATGLTIRTVNPSEDWEVAGVNSRVQLAELERTHQHNIAVRLMSEGVTLADPARIDVRGTLQTGSDVFIDVNCVFEGMVRLGSDVVIGPNCVLRNAEISDGVELQANTVIENASVGRKAKVGPFARLRPGTVLGEATHVGNFVEIKNASVGTGSKVNHLSYVGDTDIGEETNVGAGTITCNYDGAGKHRTVMGDKVFIGSNSSLVAPVKIGDGATIGAGSVITRDVEPEQLAITRAPQKVITGWQRPRKPAK